MFIKYQNEEVMGVKHGTLHGQMGVADRYVSNTYGDRYGFLNMVNLLHLLQCCTCDKKHSTMSPEKQFN